MVNVLKINIGTFALSHMQYMCFFEALVWPLFSNLVDGNVIDSFCEAGSMLTVEFSCCFSESPLHMVYMSVCVCFLDICVFRHNVFNGSWFTLHAYVILTVCTLFG